jgi:hypothetical protein
MIIGNTTLRSVSKQDVKLAGRVESLIIPILTKGSTEELTAAPTPRAAVQTALSERGGRLQFCLLHWMLSMAEG